MPAPISTAEVWPRQPTLSESPIPDSPEQRYPGPAGFLRLPAWRALSHLRGSVQCAFPCSPAAVKTLSRLQHESKFGGPRQGLPEVLGTAWHGQ